MDAKPRDLGHYPQTALLQTLKLHNPADVGRERVDDFYFARRARGSYPNWCLQ